MFEVELTDVAEADIENSYLWWSTNRSANEATRWYAEACRVIATLRVMPERCSPATESKLSIVGVRQLSFGIGKRPTHRIVFVIDGARVVVLRVRHHAEGWLSLSDLPIT